MDTLRTDDGSWTCCNEFGFYHWRKGAATEAIEKFARPARITEVAKRDAVKMLDICFGLGYNTAAAIDMARQANPNCRIEAVGLEIDPAVIRVAASVTSPFRCYSLVQKLADTPEISDDGLYIRLFMGDARDTIHSAGDGFDAVFLDPFAPKQCPELWQTTFLREVFMRMRPGALLCTYSCARMVRDNLRSAGFIVRDGPIIGRRGPATVAEKPLHPSE